MHAFPQYNLYALVYKTWKFGNCYTMYLQHFFFRKARLKGPLYIQTVSYKVLYSCYKHGYNIITPYRWQL